MIRTALSINLNKIALLRNQRDVGYPSVVAMARVAIDAGAAGITVHPRPDERHIRPSDITDLAALIRGEYSGSVEFNIEGYPTEEFLSLVRNTVPDQVTLVPDEPGQATSDHGWPFPQSAALLTPIVSKLHQQGMRVALFIDDEPEAARAAARVGAQRVELYTGPYHQACERGQEKASLARFAATAEAAHEAGLGINAGHDLNLDNLADFLAAVPYVEEVSIGHGITADALEMGMEAAVKAYLRQIEIGNGRAEATGGDS
ncbi:Pyridoxine 5'-phosphate synthase [hydrothermal vent metagenome]|uniref:Pyridoxine 5'-phosphate synthase n=1 Tax=hydrothermal vent metagenome TaxID=652676 RepID=A0A3B0TPA1_9ZZZZ